MNRLLTPALVLSLLAVVGCDKTPPPPPPTPSGGPLSGLADNPTSLLGKSAGAARSAKQGAEVEQDSASKMADEINGQAQLLTVGGVEFRPSTNWNKTEPASKMQTAALAVPGGASCVFLEGIGGSVEDNLSRWHQMVTDSSGQPAEMSTQTRIADGMKITVVSMAGTYASMASGMPVPQSGQGFRGAIIEAPRGNVFVRLSGPEAAVKDATSAWETMVYGARKQ